MMAFRYSGPPFGPLPNHLLAATVPSIFTWARHRSSPRRLHIAGIDDLHYSVFKEPKASWDDLNAAKKASVFPDRAGVKAEHLTNVLGRQNPRFRVMARLIVLHATQFLPMFVDPARAFGQELGDLLDGKNTLRSEVEEGGFHRWKILQARSYSS